MFEWVDYVHSVLAMAGLNRGAARDRIVALLAEQRCALTAVEIEDILRNRGQATARASIYRGA